MKTTTKILLIALAGLAACIAAQSAEPRAFGWKPDVGGVVDKAFGPRFRGVTIKESVDLRAKMPPVYDQGAIGSCVSQGVGVALDYAHVKSNPGMKFFTPSRLFIYYQGRVAIGTVNQDSGCQIRDAIAATQKLGAPLESLWPYREPKFKTKPPAAAYSDALNRQIIQAYKAETLDDVKTALSLDLPVVFGVPVYRALMDLSYFDYTVKMPAKNERSVGGHCMTVVGYRNSDQMLIVRNSWGRNWGRDGHCLLPFAYWVKFQRQTDAWIISVAE